MFQDLNKSILQRYLYYISLAFNYSKLIIFTQDCLNLEKKYLICSIIMKEKYCKLQYLLSDLRFFSNILVKKEYYDTAKKNNIGGRAELYEF